MSDLQNECDGWRARSEVYKVENVRLRKEYSEVFRLLGALTMHADCASSEEHADEVFCGGCFTSINEALEYLESVDPSWHEEFTINTDKIREISKGDNNGNG